MARLPASICLAGKRTFANDIKTNLFKRSIGLFTSVPKL
jgi:hypothetical protein